MAGEISFAGTPFAPLCRRAGEGRCGPVARFFYHLAREADDPDLLTEGLTRRVAAQAGLALQEGAVSALEQLFDRFGRFDREGQLGQLYLAKDALTAYSASLSEQMDGKCRSYEMLGLTAGVAVLVLVL